MHITNIHLYHIEQPLAHPFETSFGTQTTRPCILVALEADGMVGWGECSAMAGPWYSYETIATAWHILRDILAPLVIGQDVENPADFIALYCAVRGHPMARAALENSFWDLLARHQGIALAQLLGGTRERIAVGVSVGIEPTIEDLLAQVEAYIAQGYQRVKLKIKPGWDVAVVRAVRERWPHLALQVDANAAYTLDDVAIFRQLDAFGLLLIEQPLHYDDIVDHAQIQRQLRTPICLDESIHTPNHARWALDSEACRVINIKVGRVGGLTAAIEIHNLCAERGIPVWCGGMLETNVGRAVNVALSALPNFSLPGDVSASQRYFHQDIATPDFVLNDDSTITVPHVPGSGVEVLPEWLAAACVAEWRAG